MSKHIKRLATPRSWHIRKKEHVFATKPMPGAHPVDSSLPLGIVLRDYLKVCDTQREAERIVSGKNVLVDGSPAKSIKQPVGFMDTISFPKMETHYRVLVDYHGRLSLQPVSAAVAGWKLCRIENKTTIHGGRMQLNLHDGRNILVKEATAHKTGDVLKIKLPEQKVVEHYPLKAGVPAYIIGGSHTGRVATIGDRRVTNSPKPNLVSLKVGEEETSTIQEYVFVVGAQKPEVLAPEVNA